MSPGRIFISYRRGQDSNAAGRLYDSLGHAFSGDRLFMDVDSIPPGRDFEVALAAEVSRCEAFLAVIGQDWLNLRTAAGVRRLDLENDFVRVEIASALRLGKMVIPILVNDARMPAADELPESLKPLARRNAITIRHERWRADVETLIKAIETAFKGCEQQEAVGELARAEQPTPVTSTGRVDPRATLAKNVGTGSASALWTRRGALGLGAATAATSVVGATYLFRTISAVKPEPIPSGPSAPDVILPVARPSAPALKLLRTLTGHSAPVNVVAVLPGSRQALSASDDARIKLWDLDAGRELHTFSGHSNVVRSAAVSPDGSSFVSGSNDMSLKFWNVPTRRDVRTITYPAWFQSAAFLPDGKAVLTGLGDSRLKLWDASSGRDLRTFRGHELGVLATAVSRDGAFAVSGSADRTVRQWDVAAGREIRTLGRHRDWVRSVAISPDGRLAVSGSLDQTIKVWDLDKGVELRTLPAQDGAVRATVILAAGKTVLSGSSDRTVRLWDLESGGEVLRSTGYPEGVRALAVADGQAFALSGGEDRNIGVWEMSAA